MYYCLRKSDKPTFNGNTAIVCASLYLEFVPQLNLLRYVYIVYSSQLREHIINNTYVLIAYIYTYIVR